MASSRWHAASGRSGRQTSARRSRGGSGPCCRRIARRLPTSAPHSPRRARPNCSELALAAWDNLGRTGAEYPHLGALFDYEYGSDKTGRVEVDGIEHFIALRDDGRPGLIFSAHLANWELPAICAARYGLDATAVFRAPNDPAVARLVHEVRSETMGGLEAARQGAAFAMQGVLEKGGHLGMLIDQHFTRGVTVDFMGRPARVNPILGKFARRFDCPVHGVRVIRLPGHRFRLQLTPALDNAARREWRDRRAGRDADDDVGRRGLGAGISGTMAVDASALARGARSSSRQSEFPLRTLSYSMLA